MNRDLENIVNETKVKCMTTGWKKVIVYGDRHSSIADYNSDQIMKKYIKRNKNSITHIVDLGDGVDNPFMSDYAVDPKFILSSQDEFDLYAQHLVELDKISSDSKKIIIAGNHDKARLSKAKKMNRGIASLRNVEYENVLKDSIINEGGSLKNFKLADKNYSVSLTKSNNVLFTHGDPRLDPNIKGGITGARRTAMEYPFEGDIFMGHGHEFKQFPRRFDGKFLVQMDMMANIKIMKDTYVGWHPYTNGFGVIHYNKKKDVRFFQHIPINSGMSVIDNKVYEVKK